MGTPVNLRRLNKAIATARLRRLDKAIATARSAEVPTLLEKISLEDWGQLLLDIPAECPNLSARFPSMPPAHVQVSWTGSHGSTLLAESVRFTRWLVTEYEEVTRELIRDATILDFGCGWGRLMRLLYKYADAEYLYGLDPWDESIRICREHGVLGHLAISDYVPKTLPFAQPFDLIYAFSVFTHLSERTTRVVLETLRKYIADGGALAITIRPAAYWQYSGNEEMIVEHDRRGFAFVPHQRAPIDGDITYGDTSMTVDYLAREFPFWRIVRTRTSAEDPFQTFLLLLPA